MGQLLGVWKLYHQHSNNPALFFNIPNDPVHQVTPLTPNELTSLKLTWIFIK